MTYVPDLLVETVNVHEYGLRVNKNNFMFQNMDKTMLWIIQGGIPEYFVKFVTETAFWYRGDDPYEPKVFSLKDLEFGFVTWLVTCAIAIVIFLLEVFCEKIKTLIGFYLFSSHFMRFVGNRVLL